MLSLNCLRSFKIIDCFSQLSNLQLSINQYIFSVSQVAVYSVNRWNSSNCVRSGVSSYQSFRSSRSGGLISLNSFQQVCDTNGIFVRISNNQCFTSSIVADYRGAATSSNYSSVSARSNDYTFSIGCYQRGSVSSVQGVEVGFRASSSSFGGQRSFISSFKRSSCTITSCDSSSSTSNGSNSSLSSDYSFLCVCYSCITVSQHACGNCQRNVRSGDFGDFGIQEQLSSVGCECNVSSCSEIIGFQESNFCLLGIGQRNQSSSQLGVRTNQRTSWIISANSYVDAAFSSSNRSVSSIYVLDCSNGSQVRRVFGNVTSGGDVRSSAELLSEVQANVSLVGQGVLTALSNKQLFSSQVGEGRQVNSQSVVHELSNEVSAGISSACLQNANPVVNASSVASSTQNVLVDSVNESNVGQSAVGSFENWVCSELNGDIVNGSSTGELTFPVSQASCVWSAFEECCVQTGDFLCVSSGSHENVTP